MSTRIERLRLLGAGLAEELKGLEVQTNSRACIVFLETLARCEAFLTAEQRKASADELIGEAIRQREQHARLLSEWAAAGLNLARIEDGAADVLAGRLDAADWGRECLLIAAVVPWLPEGKAVEASARLEEAEAWATANPEAFARCSDVAVDRIRHERPDRMSSTQLNALLSAFNELPELIGVDADDSEPAPLDELVKRISAESWAAANREVKTGTSAVASLVQPAKAADRPMLLAAASGMEEHALLKRIPAGELLLVRAADHLELRWRGEGAPVVESDDEVLASKVEGSELRWRLPVIPDFVVFRHGATRFEVPLGAAHTEEGTREDRPDRELRDLSDLAAFAPRSVERRVRQLAATGPTWIVREAHTTMLAAAPGWGVQAWPGSVYCCFPAVAEVTPYPWFKGAVLHAVAGDLALSTYSGIPVEKAGLDERTVRVAKELSGHEPLSLSPSPRLSARDVFRLEGDSMLGALAVAAEASRRGVAVPDSMVVSAGISGSSTLWTLDAVNDCDRKRALLEVEKPGCDFYFVSATPVQQSDIIRLHPLPPGAPLSRLFDLLPPAVGKRESVTATVLLREAGPLYADQLYPEAGSLYRKVLQLAPAGRDRFVALVRLGAIALHEGDSNSAWKRLTEAEEITADTVSRQDTAEQRYLLAQALVDAFEPGKAKAVLDEPLRYWSGKLERVGESAEARMLLIGLLAASRLLKLLEGDLAGALNVQREALTWAPRTELARCYGDLAEVLRRNARIDEADAAIAAAFTELPQMPIESYRLRTEAFLHYHRARLRLFTGRAIPELERLEQMRSWLAPMESEAASWRLNQIHWLLLTRDGDPAGAAGAVQQVNAEGRPFRKWYEALGLLQAAREPWAAPAFRSTASAALETLSSCVENHPELQQARSRFVLATERGQVDAQAESTLLQFAAY